MTNNNEIDYDSFRLCFRKLTPKKFVYEYVLPELYLFKMNKKKVK